MKTRAAASIPNRPSQTEDDDNWCTKDGAELPSPAEVWKVAVDTEADETISPKLKRKIVFLLDTLLFILEDLPGNRRRGRPTNRATVRAACLALYLVEHKKIKVAAAVSATINQGMGTTESRLKRAAAVERELRKQRKRKERGSFSDTVIDAALKRLGFTSGKK